MRGRGLAREDEGLGFDSQLCQVFHTNCYFNYNDLLVVTFSLVESEWSKI